MKEITISKENGELIAHIYIEENEVRAILENGLIATVDGKKLEKPTIK